MSDDGSRERKTTETVRTVQFKVEDDVRQESLGDQQETQPKKRYRQTKNELLAEKAKSIEKEKSNSPKKIKFDLNTKNGDSFKHAASNPTLLGAVNQKNRFCSTAMGFNDTRKKFDKYNMHQIRPLESNQKHIIGQAEKDIKPQEGIYMSQLRNLREVAKKDKDHFYTWSDKFFTLSIDPYTEREVKKEQILKHKSKMRTTNGFVSKLRDPTTQEHPKKLHYTKVEELKYNPYHIQQEDKKKMLVDRDRENLPRNKPLFKNYLPKIDHTKEDQTPMDNMSLTEKLEFEKEKNHKEKNDWKNKMVVTDQHFYVNKIGAGTYNLDKYRGMLHDSTIKKGLIMKKKYIKESTLDMDQCLQNMPISYNLKEEQPDGFAVKQGNDHRFNSERAIVPRDFNTQ